MPSVQSCFIYICIQTSPRASRSFWRLATKAKAGIADGSGAGLAAASGNIPVGAGLKWPQDLRTRGRWVEIQGEKKKKRLLWRFFSHDQKEAVQRLFPSTINPSSQEISRLFLRTQASDSSNNLLRNNKETFSRRDYNQGDFAKVNGSICRWLWRGPC